MSNNLLNKSFVCCKALGSVDIISPLRTSSSSRGFDSYSSRNRIVTEKVEEQSGGDLLCSASVFSAPREMSKPLSYQDALRSKGDGTNQVGYGWGRATRTVALPKGSVAGR